MFNYVIGFFSPTGRIRPPPTVLAKRVDYKFNVRLRLSPRVNLWLRFITRGGRAELLSLDRVFCDFFFTFVYFFIVQAIDDNQKRFCYVTRI